MRRRAEATANSPYQFTRPPPESPLWGLTAPPVRPHRGGTSPVRQHSECGRLEGWRWYAVQSEPSAEQSAASELREAGFQTFLPLESVDRGQGRRHRVVSVPFFPSYLFTTFGPTDDWTVICRTPGVAQLIRRQWGQPAPLPDGFVEAMLAKASALGVVADSTEAARAAEQATGIVGKTVRVVNGPFASFFAQCVAATGGRVDLLLDIFGRTSPVTLGLSDVEIV